MFSRRFLGFFMFLLVLGQFYGGFLEFLLVSTRFPVVFLSQEHSRVVQSLKNLEHLAT